jgi:hypothetical protein
MIRIVAAVLAAVLACNGESAAKRPAEPASGSASAPATPAGAALPADQQCLPGNICQQWVGCALVARGEKWWTVIAADQFPAGEPVEVKNLCPGAEACVAATGLPKGAPCTPLRTPILVKPPPYTCVWDGRACTRRVR